jgi:peptidoglycan/LPS O-acetylase OafA/YrhL
MVQAEKLAETSADSRLADAGSLGRRLAFLDALRGIAASLVVLNHVGEQVSPGFRAFKDHVVDIGQLGVVIFFLCSGFVIPATLERDGSVRTFWIKRFFRLYPLFWLSLAIAAVLAYTGVAANGHLTPRDWVANATMVPGVFRSPLALPVYWTLGYEMLFYALVTTLLVFRLGHLAVETALLAAGACALFALGSPVPTGAQINGAPFWIGSMLVGHVLFQWFTGQRPARTAALCIAAMQAAGLLLVFTSLYDKPRPAGIGVAHFGPMVTAWVGAYVLFLGALALRTRRMSALAALGAISYSLYVLHPVVLVIVPLPSVPMLAILTGFVVSVAVSVLTYRYVERPAIRLGRAATGRVHAAAIAAVVAPEAAQA